MQLWEYHEMHYHIPPAKIIYSMEHSSHKLLYIFSMITNVCSKYLAQNCLCILLMHLKKLKTIKYHKYRNQRT